NFNSYDSDRYLEKIFQVEISLPLFEKSMLIKVFLESIKSISGQMHDAALYSELAKNEYQSLVTDWLDHIRDVSRIANALALNLKGLINEVDHTDFILLELLRMKYPLIYVNIFRSSNTILELSDGYYKG